MRVPYLNPKQMAFMKAQNKLKTFIGGRGSGKSAVLGAHSQQCVQTMPRSRGALMSDTDETIRNRSLPSIIEYWETIGLLENEDFVIGKTPPSHFHRPFNKVTKYGNVISFANGTSLDLISLYSKKAGRGGNYQWIMVDEAALVDRNTFLTNIVPAIRGNYHRIARIDLPHEIEVPFGTLEGEGWRWQWVIPFRENPYYASIALVSSMPWTSDGMWLLDYEEDPQAFYIEGTGRDNEAVLGPGYMERMRQALPELIYLVEVENHRLGQIPDGFYANFSDTHHTTRESASRSDLPLLISLDFNAGFNSMVVAQYYEDTLWIIDELWVKGNQIVEDLIDKFLKAYDQHENKQVEIYGDRNGNNRYADSKRTIYEGIEDTIRDAGGWAFYRPHKGLDAPHAEKHQMINQGLKEDPKTRLPRIRIARKCKALIISITTAPIGEGFKKDKRSETRKSVVSEHATHLSDCLDNLYVFAFRDRWSIGSNEPGGIYIG